MKSKPLSLQLCSPTMITYFKILRVEALNTPKCNRFRHFEHNQIK